MYCTILKEFECVVAHTRKLWRYNPLMVSHLTYDSDQLVYLYRKMTKGDCNVHEVLIINVICMTKRNFMKLLHINITIMITIMISLIYKLCLNICD